MPGLDYGEEDLLAIKIRLQLRVGGWGSGGEANQWSEAYATMVRGLLL